MVKSLKFSTIWKTLSTLLPIIGTNVPGFELNIPSNYRRIILPCLKMAYIWTLAAFYTYLIYSIEDILIQKTMANAIRKSLYTLNLATQFHRSYVLMGNEIIEIINIIDNCLLKMERFHRKENMTYKQVTVNRIGLTVLIFLSIQDLVLRELRNRSTSKKELLPGFHILGESISNLIEQSAALVYILSTIGFEWILLALLNSCSSVLNVLSAELEDIFLSVSNNRNHHGRNERLRPVEAIRHSGWSWQSESQGDEVSLIAATPEEYATQDVRLNQWIQVHVDIFKCAGKMKRTFHLPVATIFLGNLLMTSSFITTSFSKKGVEPSMMPCTVFLLIMQYQLCNFGDNFTNMSATIAKEAVNSGAYLLYPKHMQKALLIILEISQQRPFSIDLHGLFSLTRESFLSAELIQEYSRIMDLREL